MSDSNRVQLSYIAESSYGVTPSGALKIMRIISESLKQTTKQQSSAEIRSDRQNTDVIRTSVQAEGDIGFELSATAHDDFLAAALCSAAWSSPVTVDSAVSTISAANGDNSFNKSGGFTGTAVANQWIKVSGFATAANNGYFKVVSVTSTKIVVSGGTLTTEATGASVTIKMAAQIVNGVTTNSFSIEKKYTDLTNIFAKYLGMVVAGFNMSFGADAKFTGAFQLIGKSEASAAATIGTSYTSPSTNDVLAGTDDVAGVLEAGANYPITSFSMSLNNGVRGRLQVGTLGLTSVGLGQLAITGQLQAYFSTVAAMDKYLSDTGSSLAIVIQDASAPGNAYVIEFPSVRFSTGSRSAGGQSQDILADLGFVVKMHATEQIMMRISRWP